MRWVVIAVVVVAVLYGLVVLMGLPKRPKPEVSMGRSMRIFMPPPADDARPDDSRDRSRDE